MQHFRIEDAAVVLAGARAAREYFEPIFLARNQELVLVALCDDKVRLNLLLSFPGDEHSCLMSLSDVFRCALDYNAMIVAHNHPSGDPRASEADLRLTQKLGRLCEALDVAFLDHLIFGGGEMFSFRRAGLL